MNTSRSAAIESIWPGLEAGVPKPLMPYSPAIRAGNWVFVAGQIASDFKTGLAPEVRAPNPKRRGERYFQGEDVLRNLANTMKAAGCDPDRDMVRLWQWFVAEQPTVQDFARGDNAPRISIRPYLDAREELLGRAAVPCSSLGVKELLCRGTRIEVDMICRTDEHEPRPIQDDASIRTVGLKRGDWVFLAAENAIDSDAVEKSRFSKSETWTDSSVEAQTDIILEKLSGLGRQGGSLYRRSRGLRGDGSRLEKLVLAASAGAGRDSVHGHGTARLEDRNCADAADLGQPARDRQHRGGRCATRPRP